MPRSILFSSVEVAFPLVQPDTRQNHMVSYVKYLSVFTVVTTKDFLSCDLLQSFIDNI